ncbi:unnamed protein product [Rhizoctonia solani]|uniref:Uncharacterized protein n=1 Tax=Rhizoctonia solani TaxID=456999 RepID=A0A8H3AXB3_9AGAM|nr:unnamed protein product [Rhizoctonia solani]
MFVFPNCQQASDFFVMSLFPWDDHLLQPAYKITPDEEFVGFRAEHDDPGRGKLICVTRNVVFTIEGFNDNKDLKPYEDVVKEQLTAMNAATPLEQHDVNLTFSEGETERRSESGVKTFQVSDKGYLAIKAEAPGGLFYCDKQHQWILTPMVSKHSGDVGSMAFEFRARNKGRDVFSIVACGETLAPVPKERLRKGGWDHFDVQVIEIEITVV